MDNRYRIVLLAGVSGSGKSTALNALEDMGFSCVDNLPASLLPSFADYILRNPGQHALLMNCRTSDSFQHIEEVTEHLRSQGQDIHWIYFDAQDDILLRRFKETRRPHPMVLPSNGVPTIEEALSRERTLLGAFRVGADRIIDTSFYSPHDLRHAVEEYFAFTNTLSTTLLSFGFKYGLPRDADLVVDVRFLPNPHFVEGLREKTGLENSVRDYVLSAEEAQEFLGHYTKLLNFLLPKYQAEGKRNVTVAIGCTGGRHRSVSLTIALAEALNLDNVSIRHRDIEHVS